MRTLLALAPVLFVAACGGAPAAPPPASGAPVAVVAPAAAIDGRLALPFARNVEPLIDDAPTIVVDREHVSLDGEVLGDVRALESLGKLHKVDLEFNAMKSRREAWKTAHPGAPFPGVASLKVIRSTKALIVKDVFQTAAFAGFPNLSFVVETAGASAGAPTLARLTVDAQFPGPPDLNPAPIHAPDPVLFVRLAAPQVALMWRRGSETISVVEVPWSEAFERRGEVVGAPALAARVTQQWASQGTHRDPSDAKLDQAVLLADDVTELADMIAALDALAEPKREVARLGKRVSAFNLTLSVASTLSASGDPHAYPNKIGVFATSVNGRLAPEIIQRIVRQNFGSFRKCYESALKKDANLTGRVATAFVIGLDGKVSSATSDPTSDMPDRAVVQCVVKAFSALTFPAPEGGIVNVVYPIQFSPGTP